MTTNIQKWGNSQGIRIPKFILDAVHWDGDEAIEISVEKDKLVLAKAAPSRRDIRALFADYDGNYTPQEMDWGEPKGNEIW